MQFSSAAEDLSHIDHATGLPTMVDVGHKAVTRRTATAVSRVFLPPNLATLFSGQEAEAVLMKKGPVLATAVIAGTQAVKNTSSMIPFCHPLPIDGIKFEVDFDEPSSLLSIQCRVVLEHKTGVEMEALVGASVAALTVYDMCKAVTHEMVIKDTKLLTKTGGKSDLSLHQQ
jgi:cyclic pyranopterin phosphate synthase